MNARFKQTTATLPSIGVALLPKAVCPMCSPAYTAILSSIGLPFLATASYLFPMTLTLVTIGVASLFVGARRRRGLAPFWLAVAAAMLLLIGKFWIDSPPATFIGVAVLVAASMWNAIPKRTLCPACQPDFK